MVKKESTKLFVKCYSCPRTHQPVEIDLYDEMARLFHGEQEA